MSTSETVGDKATWLIINVVWYPGMADFDETREQALKQGQAIPVKAKWKSVLVRLPLLTSAQACLDGAVNETFGGLSKPEDPAKPTLVPGINF